MTEDAIEARVRVNRRARVDLFPTPNNLAALMALVLADLSEPQRETLIFQRGVELTAVTVGQLREFFTTLFHAPKSSLEKSQGGSQVKGPDHSLPLRMVNRTNVKVIGLRTMFTGDEGFLDECEDIFWIYDKERCFWMKNPFQGTLPQEGWQIQRKREEFACCQKEEQVPVPVATPTTIVAC